MIDLRTLMWITLCVASSAFVLGIAAGWSLALQKVSKREALRRDLRAELRDPIDASFDVVARRAGGA